MRPRRRRGCESAQVVGRSPAPGQTRTFPSTDHDHRPANERRPSRGSKCGRRREWPNFSARSHARGGPSRHGYIARSRIGKDFRALCCRCVQRERGYLLAGVFGAKRAAHGAIVASILSFVTSVSVLSHCGSNPYDLQKRSALRSGWPRRWSRDSLLRLQVVHPTCLFVRRFLARSVSTRNNGCLIVVPIPRTDSAVVPTENPGENYG